MSNATRGHAVVVVCERTAPAAARVEGWLRDTGLNADAWYAPRDVDEVDRLVREGGIQAVVFPDAQALLHEVWAGRITLAQWLAGRTQIRFVSAPPFPDEHWLGALADSQTRWRRVHRRRQIIGGVTLSLVALAAAFLLSWLAGGPTGI